MQGSSRRSSLSSATRRTSRRRLLRRVLLAGAGAAITLACGRDNNGTGAKPLPKADGPPVAPGNATPLVPPGTPPVTRSEIDVPVATADINRFLQETLQYHETYFATVRQQQGDAAAQQEIDAVRGPYQERIAQIQASGGGVTTLRVPVVTLWGAFSFSATAYEGPLIVKDPVSVLFYWEGVAATIYDRSVELLTCRPDRADACRQRPAYQDEDDR